MDPLSQACLGASLSQSSTNDKSKLISALLIGGVSGMAPDLDVFIRSVDDPLLFLEYHRQFTHSLFFVPFGALLCTLLFYPFFQKRLSFKLIYLFSFLGFATHGFLDACTSYGTQLYWPFSNVRIAWNVVSIVDPLFTFPVLILILLGVFKKRVLYARLSLIYVVLFMCFGLIQKHRAEEVVNELALQRNHKIERMQAKPSFANRQVWKIMYEHNGRYYVDAVKLLWNAKVIEGSSVQKLDVKRDFPWLNPDSQQAKDVKRFRWFSNDYLAVSANNKNYIIDARYSYLPNRIESMWGIVLSENNENTSHVSYKINNRPDKETVEQFLEMVF